AGALVSTSAAKLSLPRDWSDRPDFAGVAPWKDKFGAGSVVTLNTGGLSRWSWTEISKDRAIPSSKKDLTISDT
ncbi:MAG: hypothetical protein Q7U92_18585, partial [Bradyrhizobium sp.]|nr:hypothetical protein [Bradyrhizobium sp.]